MAFTGSAGIKGGQSSAQFAISSKPQGIMDQKASSDAGTTKANPIKKLFSAASSLIIPIFTSSAPKANTTTTTKPQPPVSQATTAAPTTIAVSRSQSQEWRESPKPKVANWQSSFFQDDGLDLCPDLWESPDSSYDEDVDMDAEDEDDFHMETADEQFIRENVQTLTLDDPIDAASNANPFAASTQQASQTTQPSVNPFAQLAGQTSSSGGQSQTTSQAANPFAQNSSQSSSNNGHVQANPLAAAIAVAKSQAALGSVLEPASNARSTSILNTQPAPTTATAATPQPTLGSVLQSTSNAGNMSVPNTQPAGVLATFASAVNPGSDAFQQSPVGNPPQQGPFATATAEPSSGINQGQSDPGSAPAFGTPARTLPMLQPSIVASIQAESALALSQQVPFTLPKLTMGQVPHTFGQNVPVATKIATNTGSSPFSGLSPFSVPANGDKSQQSVLGAAATQNFTALPVATLQSGTSQIPSQAATPPQSVSSVAPTSVFAGLRQENPVTTSATQNPAPSSLPQPSSIFAQPSSQPSLSVTGSASNPFAALTARTASQASTSASHVNGDGQLTSLNNPFSIKGKSKTSTANNIFAPNTVTVPNGGSSLKSSNEGHSSSSSTSGFPAAGNLLNGVKNVSTQSSNSNQAKGTASASISPSQPANALHHNKDASSILKPTSPLSSANGKTSQTAWGSGNALAGRKASSKKDDSVSKQTRANRGAQPPPQPVGQQSDRAKAIEDQLRKDGIRPPKLPKDASSPSNRKAVENAREPYKQYRDQVRASLIKAGLLDNPEVQKKLSEAIDFQGICEDMCPDNEKINRIVQHDVKLEERVAATDGTMQPSLPHMVKCLARSAAGQESPLPMDVRSTGALKRTTDYLFDEILVEDTRLPSRHNFLWDRTRAIRRDFIFYNNPSAEQLLDQVYCLEKVVRFHAVALHLLSQKDFAAEDFSEKQEVEQLSKSMLSLIEAYGNCQKLKVQCPNEAEFRAYSLVLRAEQSDFQEMIADGDPTSWTQSDVVQTAMTLVQAMQSIFDWRGPLKPAMPTAAMSSFSTFFRVVEDRSLSYTMACFAEIHFKGVRRAMLNNLTHAYHRKKDAPKDITVSVLNDMLRFDTTEEAVDFAEQHGFSFSISGAGEKYIVLDKVVQVGNPTVRQSFSGKLVERKRGDRSLPEVIHSTVFEEDVSPSLTEDDDDQDSLFVKQNPVLSGDASQSTPCNKPAAPVQAATISSLAPQPSLVHTPATQSPAAASSSRVGVSSVNTELFKPSSSSSIFSPLPGNVVQTSKTPAFSMIPEKSTTPMASLFPPGSTSATNNSASPNITITPPTPHFPPPTRDSKLAQQGTTSQTALPNPLTRPNSQTQTPGGNLPKSLPSTKIPAPLPKAAQPASLAASIPKPSRPSQIPSVVAPRSADNMAGFAKWVVRGDGGLFEEFLEAYTHHLLSEVYDRQQKEEQDQKQQAEDAKSLAEAVTFRRYSLRVKWFYHWRMKARNNALNRKAKQMMKASIVYQEAKAQEEREAKKRAAEKAQAKRKARESVSFMEELDLLRQSKRPRVSPTHSRRESRDSLEEALLATGVFNGIRDERAVAAQAIRDSSPLSNTRSIQSPKSQPLRTLKEGLSSSVSSIKDKISGRISKKGGSDIKSPPRTRIDYFRQSLPGRLLKSSLNRTMSSSSGRMTNFDRARRSTSVDEEESQPKRKSAIRSSHWRLRSMGMIHMPNKQYLHESLALPMLKGKRFKGIGNYGLPPVANEASNGANKLPDGMQHWQRLSTSQPHGDDRSPPSAKRRRSTEEDDDTGLPNAAESPSSAKKQKTGESSQANTLAETERIIREMREAADGLDEGKEWFKEKNELMKQGIMPWEG